MTLIVFVYRKGNQMPQFDGLTTASTPPWDDDENESKAKKIKVRMCFFSCSKISIMLQEQIKTLLTCVISWKYFSISN